MTTPIQTIVIGTSLSDSSDHVVRTGLAAARAVGARVHLVHAFVYPAQYYGDYVVGQVWADSDLMQQHEAWRHERLAAQVARLGIRAAELGGQTVGLGAGHRLIVDAAAAVRADLVVVGATEHGRTARVLGTTADRVIRQAVCPVLVVRDEPPMPPRRVLAPVDLSALSGEAFACGLEVLRQIAAGTPIDIEALYVMHHHLRDGSHPVPTAEVARLAHDDLTAFVAPCRDLVSGQLTLAVRPGRPNTVILEALAAQPADLVLMGTHGRSGFERFLTGSVALDVARGAHCSVLIVPPAAAKAVSQGTQGRQEE